MVTTAPAYIPQVGDLVVVRLGLYEDDGEIIEVYGEGTLARAMVRVDNLGADGKLLSTDDISLPFRFLRLR